MRVGDVVRGQKAIVTVGPWSDDKLKVKDFPLLKKRSRVYPMTRQWRWQVSQFHCEGRQFRLLASYHKLVPEFAAVLAEDVGADCRVLARWEYHATHDGWHIHSSCRDIDNDTPGIVKPSGTVRIPAAGTYHRHKNLLNDGYGMDDVVATAIAFELCNLPHGSDLFVKKAIPWS